MLCIYYCPRVYSSKTKAIVQLTPSLVESWLVKQNGIESGEGVDERAFKPPFYEARINVFLGYKKEEEYITVFKMLSEIA